MNDISVFAIAGFMYVIIPTIMCVLAFLPTIVAWRRHHPDLLWIFIVNFGFGWTAIGWIFPLVWAFKSDWLIADAWAAYKVANNCSQNVKDTK